MSTQATAIAHTEAAQLGVGSHGCDLQDVLQQCAQVLPVLVEPRKGLAKGTFHTVPVRPPSRRERRDAAPWPSRGPDLHPYRQASALYRPRLNSSPRPSACE